MAKRSNMARGGARGENYGPAEPGDHSPAGRLEAVRLLLDQGRSHDAQTSLTALIKSARGDTRLLARARRALRGADDGGALQRGLILSPQRHTPTRGPA